MKRSIIKTSLDFKEFLNTFKGTFSFDTETTDLNYTRLEMEGFSLCDGASACYVDLIDNPEQHELLLQLKELFSNAKTIIAHNIVFDLKVLHKYGITCQHLKIYDTMIADHLLDEYRSHSLKNLSAELLYKKTIKYEEAEKAGHQSDLFYEYAINDAVWTWELCLWQQPHMKEQNLVKLFRDIEMPFQFVLLEMEVTGVLVDLDLVSKTAEDLREKSETLISELLDILGERPVIQATLTGGVTLQSPINFNSTKVLADIMFNKLGLNQVETTPSGNPAVGKNTLWALKDKHPFVSKLLDYRIVQKLLTAFFEPLPGFVDGDGRVRPQFIDTGTKTGRLACRKPNLQQLPKANKDMGIDTRACFVVPKGYKMIACDYSGQEVRVMAQVSKDPTLVSSLNNGYDMHLAVANKFYNLGIPEEALNSTHSEHEAFKDKFKDERTKAKTITFGLAYGKGAFGFSKDFGISEEEAQKIVDDYFNGMPGLRDAIDNAHKELETNGSVTSMAGRKRRFTPNEQGYYPGQAFRQSFNFLIQGFSADMIRKAMVLVCEEAKKYPDWDLKTIATVHDESVYQVKEEYVDKAMDMIKEQFEQAVKFIVPVVADVSMGDNYGEAK